MIKKSCVITGHRPMRFAWKYKENDTRCKHLKRVMQEQFVLLYEKGTRRFYVGGALGVDQWAGEILLRLKEQPEVGVYLVAIPLVTAFTSDAFALFAGMLFGRHKLAPALSPKKTVEGAVGGLVGAVVCTMLYGVLIHTAFGVQANYLSLAVYGAVGSVFSQLGDLSFSYIKRQYQIKDFGNIFPGHGGVLDRFDSVIFCAPLIEVLCALLPAIKL